MDRPLYAQSQTDDLGHEGQRPESRRNGLQFEHARTHTHAVSLILARVWNAIRNAIRGLTRERGQRKDMIRTRAEVQTCRVFPLVAGHRPTPPDTASPAVYVPDYITVTIPLPLFDKPIVMLSYLRVNTIRSHRGMSRKVSSLSRGG